MGSSVFGTVRDGGLQAAFDTRWNTPQHGGEFTQVCVCKSGDVYNSSQGWLIEVVPAAGRVYLSHLRYPTLQDVLDFSALEYVGDESTLPDLGHLAAVHEDERFQENFELAFSSTFTAHAQEPVAVPAAHDEPEIYYTPGSNCCAICDKKLGTRQRIFSKFLTTDSIPKILCERCYNAASDTEVAHVA